ncbi:hypothetical protein GCM10027417_30640 [Glutamicibacter endophyticus]
MSDEMITVQQLADKLQCSIRTVQLNVRNKKWPHVKLGPKIVRFTQEQVDGIISGAMVAAEAPDRAPGQSARIRELMRQLNEREG